MDIPNKNAVILKYFVLPIYGISYTSIKSSYINSYLNKEGTNLFIRFNNFDDEPKNLPNYLGSVAIEDNSYIVLGTPEEYLKDIRLIIKGKYSLLSKKAKDRIRVLSGLTYKVNKEKNIMTVDAPLLALDRHPKLKEILEKELNVTIDKESELFDKLTESGFIENVINQ